MVLQKFPAPAFSMTATLDVQRDQVALIQDALRLLEPGGILIFSNNLRRFQLDREALDSWGALEITNTTAATLPKAFARNPRIPNVWRIEWTILVRFRNRGRTPSV
mgnify:CR=1 FL=1